MNVLKFILGILAAIGIFNTGIAYLSAFEKICKEISERWAMIYIVISILSLAAMIFLGIIDVPM